MIDDRFETLPHYDRMSPDQMTVRAQAFLAEMQRRRTVREFSSEPVPQAVIEQAILAAGTAPSGANMQPWHFVVVRDAAVKRRLREAAEIEEREFYQRRASAEWLRALEPLAPMPTSRFWRRRPC